MSAIVGQFSLQFLSVAGHGWLIVFKSQAVVVVVVDQNYIMNPWHQLYTEYRVHHLLRNGHWWDWLSSALWRHEIKEFHNQFLLI